MKDYMPGWYAMVLAYKRGIIDGPRRSRHFFPGALEGSGFLLHETNRVT